MKRTILICIALLISMGAAFAAATDSPDIRISQISQTPDPVDAGDYVDLRFRVDNTGAPASDYVYEIEYDYPFTLDPGSAQRVSVGTVDSYQAASDQGAVLFWRLRVDENAVPGDANTVRVRYYPRSSEDTTYFTQDYTIRIGAEEGLLVVSDASIEPDSAVPGQRVSVGLELENLGTAAIRNVRVTSDVGDTSFAPYGAANERLVRLIGAGRSEMVSFDFFVEPDASLGVEKLPFTIAYSDSVGDSYTLDAIVGVPIDQTPSYIVNLESSEVFTRDASGDIVFSVSNTGASPLDFVVLSIGEAEGFEVVGPRQTYLGNLQSDDFETGQFALYVDGSAPMPLEVPVTIAYRTAYGEQVTDTVTVEVPLYTHQRAQQLGLETANKGPNPLVFILIVLAGVGGFVWWRRRRSR